MKKTGIIFGITMILALGGCGAQLPDMTDEQQKAIGEYAAVMLLKHDANSRSRLVDLSQVQEPAQEIVSEVTEPEVVEPVEPEPEIPEEPAAEAGEGITESESLESFLELEEGMTVTCLNAEVMQSYSAEGNDYFALEASEGKSLLVLNFTINNATAEDQPLDLLHRRNVYRVVVNGSYMRTALTTMLANDMTTYDGTIPAGGSVPVVLVIEADKEYAENLSSIELNLKNDLKICTINYL